MEQPYLGDLLTMVINHLLTGMILQAPPSPENEHDWLENQLIFNRRYRYTSLFMVVFHCHVRFPGCNGKALYCPVILGIARTHYKDEVCSCSFPKTSIFNLSELIFKVKGGPISTTTNAGISRPSRYYPP